MVDLTGLDDPEWPQHPSKTKWCVIWAGQARADQARPLKRGHTRLLCPSCDQVKVAAIAALCRGGLENRELALELVCGVDFWCNRHCKTSPVVVEGFWGQVWPKIGRKPTRKFRIENQQYAAVPDLVGTMGRYGSHPVRIALVGPPKRGRGVWGAARGSGGRQPTKIRRCFEHCLA
jgi:hypothetical protein